LALYLAALGAGVRPPRELELVPERVRSAERVMLGLRLDEPLPLAQFADYVDAAALGRLERLGLARTVPVADRDADTRASAVTLTRKGRLLGDAVTADLMA
jgi:coproporphyrinogen III oxidase-like Fe-S oxidoreductase